MGALGALVLRRLRDAVRPSSSPCSSASSEPASSPRSNLVPLFETSLTRTQTPPRSQDLLPHHRPDLLLGRAVLGRRHHHRARRARQELAFGQVVQDGLPHGRRRQPRRAGHWRRHGRLGGRDGQRAAVGERQQVRPLSLNRLLELELTSRARSCSIMLAGIVIQLGTSSLSLSLSTLFEPTRASSSASPKLPSPPTTRSSPSFRSALTLPSSPSQPSWSSTSCTWPSGTSSRARSSLAKELASSSCCSRCSPRRSPSSFEGCVLFLLSTLLTVVLDKLGEICSRGCCV